MHRYLIICATVLAACGPDPVAVPAPLLTPCPGWQGRTPATEGELIRAGAAERAGRVCANGKLKAVAGLVAGGAS